MLIPGCEEGTSAEGGAPGGGPRDARDAPAARPGATTADGDALTPLAAPFVSAPLAAAVIHHASHNVNLVVLPYRNVTVTVTL